MLEPLDNMAVAGAFFRWSQNWRNDQQRRFIMFSKRKCPNCGAKNSKERMTCAECGAPLASGQAEDQQAKVKTIRDLIEEKRG